MYNSEHKRHLTDTRETRKENLNTQEYEYLSYAVLHKHGK